jgi:hypothetical protein
MADNVVADPGAGGSTFATDDIAGVHYPRSKVSLGADGTAVDAIGVSAALDSTGSGVQATGVLGQFDDAATATVTENQFAPVRISSRRALLVEGVASGTVIPVSDGADSLTVDNAALSVVGGGAEATALRVTIANDSTGVVSVDDNGGALTVDNGGTFAVQVDGSALTALQLIDDIVKTDDAAFTPATDEVAVAGFFADETATDSVDEGDAGAARMTLDRKQIVTPYPHTAGGLTIFRSIDLDETEEEVKGSAGQVYGLWVTNTATSTRWLKFYNATAANVTVGTTAPVITIGIPGNTSDDVSGNFGPGGMGIAFDTAITVAATTGVADADTGAPAANDVIVNIFYK